MQQSFAWPSLGSYRICGITTSIPKTVKKMTQFMDDSELNIDFFKAYIPPLTTLL